MTGPPGRGRSSGPVATPGRPLKARSPQPPPQGPAAAMVARVIALSDERDTWLRWVLAAWRDGYAAGRRSMDNAVTTAYIDGLLRRKGIEHDHIRALTGGTDRVDLWQDQQRRTWGPGGREHFADPRPGEYAGGPVAWDGGRRS